MKAVKEHTGRMVPLMRDDVDTDQIIPKQYLKGTEKTGYGEALFDPWRYDEEGRPHPDFPLNQPRYRGATILVSGENFGCGSSREHAAWALQDYGFHVIIAGSFSPIFTMNWLNNGHLPIRLPKEQREALAALPAGTEVRIDLETQTVEAGTHRFDFPIEASWKARLLAGEDAIARTLRYEKEIRAFEENQAVRNGGVR